MNLAAAWLSFHSGHSQRYWGRQRGYSKKASCLLLEREKAVDWLWSILGWNHSVRQKSLRPRDQRLTQGIWLYFATICHNPGQPGLNFCIPVSSMVPGTQLTFYTNYCMNNQQEHGFWSQTWIRIQAQLLSSWMIWEKVTYLSESPIFFQLHIGEEFWWISFSPTCSVFTDALLSHYK